MALSFNSATKKWERTPAPVVASSITGQLGVTNPAPTGNIIAQNTGTNVNDSQRLYGTGVTNPAPTVTPPVTATSTNNVAPSFIGMPKATVATKDNPVVDMSKPKQTPAFNQYDTSAVSSLDMNGLQDFIDQTNIDVRRGTPLTPEREAQLYKAQRRLQELSMAQQIANPIEPQISALEEQKKKEAERLALQSTNLIDKRRAELEAQYGARASELDKQGQDTMSAAQGVLSFSGFGRSTYAADKQAEIQQNVNQAKQTMQAEKDYAIARYQAELAGADAETLASYDEQIGQLRQLNTKFLIDSAQAMNEYNMQTSASYEEKISNIFKLAEANNVTDLTEQEKAQASAYGDLLLDAEGNLNTALIKDIPTRLVNEAIMQGAMRKASIKPKMEAPKTASDGAGNLYQFNEQTGERTTIGSAGKEFKTVGEQAYAFDPTTGQTTMVAGGTTGDLRGLASQFPGQARAKNNNPAGITRNNNFATGKGTAALLDQAGIPYEIGTARPKNEGGNYVSFPTIEDGLAAQRILMTQTYGNSTVQEMLGKWVGTGEALNYAKQVAGNAGVPLNIKVNQLNEQQIQQLQMAKIQKESPGLAKLLGEGGSQQSFDPNRAPQYINYIESGKLPVGMKSGTPQANQFIAEAGDGYIDAKSKDLKQKGFTISNAEAFKNVDSKTLEAVNKAISQVPAFEQAMDNIIKLVGDNGTEFPISGKGREINQKIKNAQLIAKEIYNLGVLNGPDLALMESIIANPATWTSKLEGTFVDYKDLLKKGKETILGNAYAQAQNIGLSPISKVTKYTPNTDYPAGTIIEKDGVTYSVGKDGNFYEQ